MRRGYGAFVVVALAGALVACSSAAMPEADIDSTTEALVAPELEKYYEQTLDWESCGGRVECADLLVPLDYGEPDQGDLEIAVARYPATGDRQGALVFNPGGPGGSGTEFAQYANTTVSPDILRAYDFVGFDPRGVGDSDPIDCLTNQDTDEVLAAAADPQTDAEIEQYINDAEKIAAGCQQRSPDLLGYVDSASVVNDMDILRSALGEQDLDYLGKSYGTKLGAMYADRFPSVTGRMVLDGALPPDLDGASISLGQAESFENTLRRYVEWCQSREDCSLSSDSVDAGVTEIQEFFTGLDGQPLVVGDRELTEGLAMQAVLYYLYFPFAGDWASLNRGLGDAFSGDGSTLLSMLDQRLERDTAGNYKNNGNSYDAFLAITCLDDGSDLSVAELSERAKDWEAVAPTFGPALSWSELVCTEWPVPAKERPKASKAAGAGPILVVSTTHDPATPVVWAEKLATDLADSRLVVVDADGHTAYGNGSSCIDRTVDEFLLDGVLPESDLTCDDGWEF